MPTGNDVRTVGAKRLDAFVDSMACPYGGDAEDASLSSNSPARAKGYGRRKYPHRLARL